MIIRVTKFVNLCIQKFIIKFEKQTIQNNILNTTTQNNNGIIILTQFLYLKMPVST